MKSRPIMFSTLMIQALPHKSQTRRTKGLELINEYPDEWVYVGKDAFDPQYHIFEFVGLKTTEEPKQIRVKCPYGVKGDRLYIRQKYGILNESLVCDVDIVYGLTDDRLYAILLSEVQNGRYKTVEWSPTQTNPNITERRLHGGVGWTDLLTDKVCWLWSQGVRGLVSAQRTSKWEKSHDYIHVSPKSEGIQDCSQIDMYGFSWDAAIPIISGKTFRRQRAEQLTRKSPMGDSRRELDGQKSPRAWERRRETPNGETNGLRDESIEMGDRERISESASCSEDTWNVAGWHLCSCSPKLITWRPSMFMFRWMSRHLLELVEEPMPQRVQSITVPDAIAEGIEAIWQNPDEETNKALRNIGAKEVTEPYIIGYKNYLYKADKRFHYGNPHGYEYFSGEGAAIESYAFLWDSINGKKYPWSGNYWAWKLCFREIKP